jgi:hypothetical protein
VGFGGVESIVCRTEAMVVLFDEHAVAYSRRCCRTSQCDRYFVINVPVLSLLILCLRPISMCARPRALAVWELVQRFLLLNTCKDATLRGRL